jgi:DNA-binding transcriptional LysR family regulator
MRGATLRQLRAFSMVARHRSFGRAASELSVTRSAISMQIKELEEVMGLTLFGRGGRTAALTPAGELLLNDVNRALQALKDADEKLNRLRGRETGVVSIGMVSNAEYFVPRLLASFRAAHPEVDLRVSVANRENLLRQLANGEVVLAIMGQPPAELDLDAKPLADHPMGIVAAPNHTLADEREIPVATVAKHHFIVREQGSGTRAAMDRFFRAAGVAPAHALELAGNESIKQAVIANMGLSFLSLQAASLELRAGLLVCLDIVGLPLMRSWYVVNSPTESLNPAAQSFRSFILASGGRRSDP